jgi:recombination protein RecA
MSELVELGVMYGVIKKSGSWYTVGEETMQGDKKVAAYLLQNPELADKMEAEIYGILDGPDSGVRTGEAEADENSRLLSTV